MRLPDPVKGPLFRIVLLLLIVPATTGAFFQGHAGKIEGTLTDSSGAAVPGADITLKPQRCRCKDCPKPADCNCCPDSRSTYTNDAGVFSFTVPPGTYSLMATASGFAIAVVSEIEVKDGDTTSVKVAFSGVSSD